MVKKEIVRRVARKTGLTKGTVSKVLSAIIEEIVHGVTSDGVTVIRGFGTFRTVKRRAKSVRNFSDGKIVEIPECKVPVFIPSESFTEIVKKEVKP